MKKLGLIGFPLSHSFSKKYFATKFEKEKLKDFSYENFELKKIDDFPILLKNNPKIIGLNVTIPYKEKILSYVDYVDPLVREIGAANTLKIENGAITAFNTDIIGFEKSFIEKWKDYHEKALIFGTGGAAKSVAYVLKKLGIDYKFVSRNQINKQMIGYKDLNQSIIEKYQIFINTTPLGSYPNMETYPEIPYEFIGKKHYFYDLVYNPSKTLFLKKAEAQGADTLNGLRMLELQANASWRIWTDKN